MAAIETKHLVIVDDAGKPRITLEVNKKGVPNISLMNAQGVIVAVLGVVPNASFLNLYDSKGADAITLQYNFGLGPSLLFSAMGGGAFQLSGSDWPTLSMMDTMSKAQLRMEVRPDGTSEVTFVDRDGNQKLALPADFQRGAKAESKAVEKTSQRNKNRPVGETRELP
ncbi:MAG: hypothetical protein ACREJQ_07585 [bacterium]